MHIKHQVWWVEDGPEGLRENTETFITYSAANNRLDQLQNNPACVTADLVEVRISRAWVKTVQPEPPKEIVSKIASVPLAFEGG